MGHNSGTRARDSKILLPKTMLFNYCSLLLRGRASTLKCYSVWNLPRVESVKMSEITMSVLSGNGQRITNWLLLQKKKKKKKRKKKKKAL